MPVKVKKFKKVKNHVYQVDMKSKQNEEKKEINVILFKTVMFFKAL